MLFVNFGDEDELYAIHALKNVRAAGINAEVYPDNGKMKKQMTYANKKQIPFVVLCGEQERKDGVFTLKNMESGEQSMVVITSYSIHYTKLYEIQKENMALRSYLFIHYLNF